jgi:tetratricopeptide (TPR) repeat protein
MKNNLLLTVWCGSLSIISYIEPTLAISPAEVQKIVKQTTVRMAGCDRSSGVIIRKDGNTYTVLTVARVANKSGCEIVAPDNNKYPVTTIKNFPESVDLAVVNFTSNNNYTVAKQIDNSDRLEAGSTIYVSGFPPSSTLTLIKGNVVSNSTKPLGKGYSLIYSNDSLPKHNGGAVWNDKGEMVAIHGRENVASQNVTARVKTGYNLGITTNTFTRFAALAGVGGYPPVVLAPKLKPVDDNIALAIDKEAQGDYRGMLKTLNDAVFLDSQNPILYYMRGVAKSMLANSDAIADYTQALSLEFTNAAVYTNRGFAKFTFGNRPGALADYNKAIALAPADANAYYHRGNLKALNSPPAALADYNRAIALDSQLAPAYFRRSTVRAALKDKTGQMDDLNRAITLNSNYVAAYYTRGLIKSATADRQGAIADFDRVIALDPQTAAPYYERGSVKYELGDNQGAIEDFDRALAIDVNYAKAYASRGFAKARLKDDKGALADLKQAASRLKRQRQTASYQRVLAEIDRLTPKKAGK